MTPFELTYPFCAVVGQDLLKRALLMNAVCPALGGVLIAGDRGTAKTTTARALAALLPALAIVPGCPFRCDPASIWPGCPHCHESQPQESEAIPTPFVELPIGATEDRVAGSLDIERSLREGKPAFRAGLLAGAHRGILYIDEVNLLADHLVDLLLDAAASGGHSVEREGIAIRHPARFIFIGSMNPEEGELRHQLSDRFALRVNVHTPTAPTERAEVIRRRLDFDADPGRFCTAPGKPNNAELSSALSAARNNFASVQLTYRQVGEIAELCTQENIEGLRADLALGKGARALAALAGRQQVTPEDLQAAAELVIPHRARRRPASAPPNEENPAYRVVRQRSRRRRGIRANSWNSLHKHLSWRRGRGARDKCCRTTSRAAHRGSHGEGCTRASCSAPRRVYRALCPSRSNPVGGHSGDGCDLTGVRHARRIKDRQAYDSTRRSALEATGRGFKAWLRLSYLWWMHHESMASARRRMEAVKGVALGLLAEAGRLRDDV